MKKHIYNLLAISILGLSSFAQTSSDAYHFSSSQNFGTARYLSLGGAFGALGGDLTAVSENPASSAVFSTSYGGLTVGSNNKDFSSTYFDTTAESNRNNLVFNQIGGVLVLRSANPESSLEKVTLAINYQLENDFRNTIFIDGDANNSIADFFVGQANGIPTNVLLTNGLDDGIVYEDIGRDNRFGRTGQQAYLGFQTLLIDPSNIDNDTYVSGVTSSPNFQNTSIESSGRRSKSTLNLGLKYHSGLHLGANLNIHQIDQRRTIKFSEENSFANVGYEVNEDTFGAGISLGLGAIYSVEDIRLGISYQTPTWYEVTNAVDEFINVRYNQDVDIEGDLVSGLDIDPLPGIFFDHPDYGLRTPGKLSLSAAYIFGKLGLISTQFELQDFSNTRYDNRFSGSTTINQNIRNTFQASETFRIGAEARAKQWRFRAGANYSTSPYQDESIDGESKGFSLGIGYDWGKWKLDGTYSKSDTNFNETAFENNNFANSGNVDLDRSQITVTLGVNF